MSQRQQQKVLLMVQLLAKLLLFYCLPTRKLLIKERPESGENFAVLNAAITGAVEIPGLTVVSDAKHVISWCTLITKDPWIGLILVSHLFNNILS